MRLSTRCICAFLAASFLNACTPTPPPLPPATVAVAPQSTCTGVHGEFVKTGDMLVPRYNHEAAMLRSGQVLIVGGQAGVSALDSAELYDPAEGVFHSTGKLSTSRVLPLVTALADGRVMVLGGYQKAVPVKLREQPQLANVNQYTAEIYDPPTGTFASLGDTPLKGSNNATLLDSGKVLFVGAGEDLVKDHAWLFDPSTGRFDEAGTTVFKAGRRAVVKLNTGKVLLACEDIGPNRESAELYTPETNRFMPTGKMVPEIGFCSGVLLPDGRALIYNSWWGGEKVDLYDPKKEAFSEFRLGQSFYEGRFTPLVDGRTLVSGVMLGPSSPGVLVGFFDPQAGAVNSLSASPPEREGYSVTRLSDGDVLMAGGQGGKSAPGTIGGVSLGVAQLYCP